MEFRRVLFRSVSAAVRSLYSLGGAIFLASRVRVPMGILGRSQLIHEAQDSESSWHVKSFSFGDDAPRKKFTAVVTSLSCCSKEIRPPFRARTYRVDFH